jgi:hypothetical protein
MKIYLKAGNIVVAFLRGRTKGGGSVERRMAFYSLTCLPYFLRLVEFALTHPCLAHPSHALRVQFTFKLSTTLATRALKQRQRQRRRRPPSALTSI